MLSGMNLHAVNQAYATITASTPLSGMFLGLALDLGSDRLYDLVDDIPDVMGLCALRPSTAIVTVMSVPDSRCIRVVTPDDHLNIKFHEVLIHELADEECPECLDISLIWTRCGKNVGSVVLYHTVWNLYSRIWASILPYTTWSWRSCGDARWHGVRFGSAGLRRSYEEGA